MTKKEPDNKKHSPIQLQFKELTDRELLTYFVNRGIEAAFNELVDRHSQMVMCICLSVVSNRECAEDAFQATFLALVRNAKRLKNATSFTGWLCRVARNAAIKASKLQRKQERQLDHVEPAIELDPLNHLAAREAVLSLAEELESISSRYREALTLFYFESLSRKEIANRMGCTEEAVKSLLQRGKQCLRNQLVRRGIVPAMVGLGIQAIGRTAEAGMAKSLISETTAICAMDLSCGSASSQLINTSSLSLIGAKSVSAFVVVTAMAVTVAVTALLDSGLHSGASSPRTERQIIVERSDPLTEPIPLRIIAESQMTDHQDRLANAEQTADLEQILTNQKELDVEPIVNPEPPLKLNHRIDNRTDSITSTLISGG